MKVIDLTHLMHSDMPVYPGTDKPQFISANTIEKDGFAETIFHMYSHTGTHMDAPAHMQVTGKTLEQISIDGFVGPGLVIDLAQIQDLVITKAQLEAYENQLAKVDFVLFRTGWDKKWGTPAYFQRFPFMDKDAAKWLTSFDLRGVGIDAISIDDIETSTFEIHHILFSKGLIVIENLTCLESLINKTFLFSCLPLKYENSDGSPIRAIAIEGVY